MVISFLSAAQFSLSLCVSVKREKCPIRHGKIHHYKCTLRIWYIKKKKSCNKKISSRVKFRRRGDATTCLLVRIFSKVVTSEWHVWYVRILYFLDMEKMSYFGEWWQNLRAKNGFFVLTDFLVFKLFQWNQVIARRARVCNKYSSVIGYLTITFPVFSSCQNILA